MKQRTYLIIAIALVTLLGTVPPLANAGNEGKTKAGVVVKTVDTSSYVTFARAMKRPDPVPATEAIDGLSEASAFLDRLRIDADLRIRMQMALSPSVSRLYFKADPKDISKSNYRSIDRDYRRLLNQMRIQKKQTSVAAVTQGTKTYLIKSVFENPSMDKISKAAILIHEMFRVLVPSLPTEKVIQLEVAAQDYMEGIDYVSFYYHLADALEFPEATSSWSPKHHPIVLRTMLLYSAFLDHDFSIGALPAGIDLGRADLSYNTLFSTFHRMAQEHPRSLVLQVLRGAASRSGIGFQIHREPLTGYYYGSQLVAQAVQAVDQSTEVIHVNFLDKPNFESYASGMLTYRTCVPASKLGKLSQNFRAETCLVVIDFHIRMDAIPKFTLESLASWRIRK